MWIVSGTQIAVLVLGSVLIGTPVSVDARVMPTRGIAAEDVSVRCQQRLAWASGRLAGSVEREIGVCIEAGAACLTRSAGQSECCAAAADACRRELVAMAAAGRSFEETVGAGECARIPMVRLLDPEAGLGYSRLAGMCADAGSGSAPLSFPELVRCLRRRIEEDVVHRSANIDAPDGTTALACMDLGDDLLAAFLDDPLTCSQGGGGPTPSPTPGSTPGPDPTPGTASCSSSVLTAFVTYDEIAAPDMAGITVSIDYPEGQVAIPGGGGDAGVLGRVHNRTGVTGGLFSAGDDDSRINVGLVSIGTSIPSGVFVEIEFDCAVGAAAPAASEFQCVVDASTLLGDPVPVTCRIEVSNS